MKQPRPGGPRRTATRDYPPLAVAALCMVLLLVLLPSSLNLPQANPSQTLEYAPVPPEDENNPPPSGNFSSLGLGSGRSSGISSGSGEDSGIGGDDSAPLRGRGKNPSTKRCVGNPPRQTEDRLSPPCVAYFSGTNHGATHAGVTDNEVRILFYIDGSPSPTDHPPCDAWYDLDEPPPDDMALNPWREGIDALMVHFNDRFQTYERYVHGWIHASCGATPEERRAEAAADYERIKPFATISEVYEYRDAFQDYMASKGVLSFGSYTLTDDADHLQRPGYIWGHFPTIERLVANYVSFVCTQAVPYPVSLVPQRRGERRRFGILYTDTEFLPEQQLIRRLVEEGVRRCGGEVVMSRAQGQAGLARPREVPPQNMAAFQQAGVTTILAVGESEADHTQAGAAIDYRPEWLAMGQDISYEYVEDSRDRDQEVWRGAVLISPSVRRDPPPSEPHCATATREANPQVNALTPRIACGFYPHMLQLFTGIQVAGPRLTPKSVEKGFRAIPAIPSNDPYTPACYYEQGDYTCVKDTTSMWWDPDAETTDRISGAPTRGCWRMREDGLRYVTGDWPKEDTLNRRRPDDPCQWTD